MLMSVVSPPVDGATAAHWTQTRRLMTTGSDASERGAAIPDPYHDIAVRKDGISKANPHRHWSTLDHRHLDLRSARGARCASWVRSGQVESYWWLR
jgi:hypothetical protein